MNFSKLFLVALAALVAGASAFVPTTPRVMRLAALQGGKYDDQLWDMDAKMDVYNTWDPNAPRSEMNFNPFEKNDDGNSCDASGYYPGEGRYKDPKRPDMDYAKMLAEREIMEKIMANPKPGDVPGAPGCLN